MRDTKKIQVFAYFHEAEELSAILIPSFDLSRALKDMRQSGTVGTKIATGYGFHLFLFLI
jgi:hypothetical protein